MICRIYFRKWGGASQARFMILAAIGIGFSSSIYWTFSRSYLTEVHDFSVPESMIFWIVMGAAGIIGGGGSGSVDEGGSGSGSTGGGG